MHGDVCVVKLCASLWEWHVRFHCSACMGHASPCSKDVCNDSGEAQHALSSFQPGRRTTLNKGVGCDV